MAEGDFTHEVEQVKPLFDARRMDFTSTLGLYQLTTTAKISDMHDQLSAKLAQLGAMLLLIEDSSGSGNAFEELNDENRNNYFWACSMACREARELQSAIVYAGGAFAEPR